MKKIIINDIDILKKYITESKHNVTFYTFFNETVTVLKTLLRTPNNVVLNDFWGINGVNKKTLIILLQKYKIIEREDILTDNAEVMVKYNIPNTNIKRKVKRLYIRLFENNVKKEKIEETDCGGAMGGGGQYEAPMSSVIKKTIYSTNMVETTDSGVSDGSQYSTPCCFNKDNKNYRFAHDKMYDGGEILEDPIINDTNSVLK